MSPVQTTVAPVIDNEVKPAKIAKTTKTVKKASTTATAKTGPIFKPQMIIDALKKLNERSGSSRQAVVKYISSNFNIDPVIVNKRIKKFIATGLKEGTLKQSKGTGSNGSFKLGEAAINKEKEIAKKAKIAAKKAAKPAVAAKPKTKSAKTDTAKPKKNIKKIVKPQIPKTVSTVTASSTVTTAPTVDAKPIIKKKAIKAKTETKVKSAKDVKKVASTKKTVNAKTDAKKVVAKKTVTKKVVAKK